MTERSSDDGEALLAELRALVTPDVIAAYERDLKVFEFLERRAPPGERARRHAATERFRKMLNALRNCANLLEWDVLEGGKP